MPLSCQYVAGPVLGECDSRCLMPIVWHLSEPPPPQKKIIITKLAVNGSLGSVVSYMHVYLSVVQEEASSNLINWYC